MSRRISASGLLCFVKAVWTTMAGVQHLAARQQWAEECSELRQSLSQAQAASQRCSQQATQMAQLREDQVYLPQPASVLVCMCVCMMLVSLLTSMPRFITSNIYMQRCTLPRLVLHLHRAYGRRPEMPYAMMCSHPC